MLQEAMGSPLLPAALSLSGHRYQRWGEKKGLCGQRQGQVTGGCPDFCASGAVTPVPGGVIPLTCNVSPRNRGTEQAV